MKISQFPVRKFTRAGILTSALMLSQANALAEQVTLDDAVQLMTYFGSSSSRSNHLSIFSV